MRQGEIVISSALAMLSLGIVMVISAGIHAEITATAMSKMVLSESRLGLAAAISILTGRIIGLNRLQKYHNFLIPLFAIASIGLLIIVLIPGIGIIRNGARRWIDLGITGFQPSEIAKWLIPISIAYWCTSKEHLLKNYNGLIPPLLFIAITGILIAKEDLGTAILITTVSFILLIAAGGSLLKLLLPLPIGLAGIILFILAEPYRLQRIQTFLDPFSDPEGKGYHIVQSLAAISNGGIVGTGLGQGIRKLGYLPEDTTDFLYAIICEELGFGGAFLLALLTLCIVIPSISLINNSKCQFSALAGLGILLTFTFQGLINLFVVTGLAPTKGIALPLLSSGGTGWIMTGIAIGLLSSLDLQEKIQIKSAIRR